MDLPKPLLVTLAAQIGNMTGAITVCLLSGMWMQDQWHADTFCFDEFGNRTEDSWHGYPNTGLTIATIIVCGIAVFAQLFGLMITFFKKEDSVGAQLGLTGIATALNCVGSILIGALLGTTITYNQDH